MAGEKRGGLSGTHKGGSDVAVNKGVVGDGGSHEIARMQAEPDHAVGAGTSGVGRCYLVPVHHRIWGRLGVSEGVRS